MAILDFISKQFIDIIVWAAKEDCGYKVPRVWLKGVGEQ